MNKLLLACLLLSSCVAADDSDLTAATSSYAISLPPDAAANLLALVNYPATDLATLDTTIGLDSRAAKNIITARDGADGIAPSADDALFTTIAELDAVPYVGDAAFQKLNAYATAHPAPTGETVKTVVFTGWQAEAVIWGANNATQTALDALLDSRAVTGLLAKRTFTTVAQIGAVAYVGTSALEKLQGQALGWWNQKHGLTNLAGRFDGAVFDEQEAEIALDISNKATVAELTGHGISASIAQKIIAGRTFTTLAAVSATSGVGSSTMNALLAYAQSGTWGAAPSTCVATFDDAVTPLLPSLLFLSESDRPFDVVSFPGEGTTAPTAASVLALVAAPAGSTAELRGTDGYYVALEPSSSTADQNAGAEMQAVFAAQLTDVIYVAIHAPAGSIDDSLVDVYLVGRTSCGDLVGIHAIAVET